MPYGFEHRNMKIPKKFDRRRKLTEEQVEQVVQMKRRGVSQRRIAAAFGVSRNTIRMIVSPSYRESRRRYASMRWPIYAERYKALRNEYMTNHRRYKKELANAGLLEKQTTEE